MPKKLNKYRSKFEKTISKLFKKKKVSFKYEPYSLPYLIKADYTPDFVIGDIVIEVKGFFKPSDRRKMLAVKKAHPDLDIRLWFMKDNYLTKAKKKKYSDWAKQHSFPFHVGESFPKHWFN